MSKKGKPTKLQLWLSKKSYLVCMKSSAERQSIKNLLLSMGADLKLIKIVDTYGEARQEIDDNSPEIIFIDHQYKEGHCIDLIGAHLAKQSNRLKASAFVFSSKISEAITCQISDEGADKVILRPFNLSELETLLSNCLQPKCSPSPFRDMIEKAYSCLRDKNYEDAERLFAEAMALDANPSTCYLGLALINFEQSQQEKAYEFCKQSIVANAQNYGAQKLIFEINFSMKKFKEASENAQTLVKDFTFNPSLMPNIVRVLIATKKYDTIGNFCEYFINAAKDIPELSLPVAAGLTMASKFLIDDITNQELVKTIIDEITPLVQDKPLIQNTIVETLIKARLYTDAEKILGKFDEKMWTVDTNRLDCQLTYHQKMYDQSYSKATKLINDNKADSKTHEIAILSSIELGRSEKNIKDLIEDACCCYPESKENFEKLLTNSNE